MVKKKQFAVDDDISQGLSDVINAVENHAGDFRYNVIALSRIEVDPENPRNLVLTADDIRQGISSDDPEYLQKRDEQEQLMTLAQTIKDNGVINPVVVYKHLDKYRLIAGERRYLGALLAKKNDIHARILDTKPDVLKLRLLQWIENKERQDLSLHERLSNIQIIIDAYKRMNQVEHVTVEKLGQLAGLSKTQSSQYLSVLHAPSDLLEAIRKKWINNIDKAVMIAGVEDLTVRGSILEACLKGISLDSLKTLVKAEKERGNSKLGVQKKRGRGAVAFSLGKACPPKVAKRIIDLVIAHPNYAKYADEFKCQPKANKTEVMSLFKKLLSILERES